MHISIDITPHLVFLNLSKPHGFQKNFDSSNVAGVCLKYGAMDLFYTCHCKITVPQFDTRDVPSGKKNFQNK